MLTEELLKQAAEELAVAMIDSLPAPEQCQHPFSSKFENKMNLLISGFLVDTQMNDIAKKP